MTVTVTLFYADLKISSKVSGIAMPDTIEQLPKAAHQY